MPYTKTVEGADGQLKEIVLATMPERMARDIDTIRQATIGILIVVCLILLVLLYKA